jgi:hypothetical protein
MRIAFNKPVETMPLYCDSVGYGLKSIFETDFKRHSEPRLPSTAQINH